MLVKTIPLKFLKPPFIQSRSDENKKPVASAVFQNWQRTVIHCQSIPTVALYLSTLEPSILWGKSRLQVWIFVIYNISLQGKCRLCRRKGATETLILCDECDKCFHLGCVHLKAAVVGWVCQDCTAIRKKIAAAEKRKATKEAKERQEQMNGNKENNEDGEEDDRSMDESSMDTTMWVYGELHLMVWL